MLALAIIAGWLFIPFAATRAATPPVPIDRASWITRDDYPPEALRLRIQGMVAFMLDVDASGAVANCLVTKSSGYAVLDTATCRLMKMRGRYRVQRDEQDRPVAFQVRSTMNWRLPGQDEGRDRTVRFAAGKDAAQGPVGDVACLADYEAGPRPLPVGTCAQIVAAVRARGDTLDRPVTVWLPDAFATGT